MGRRKSHSKEGKERVTKVTRDGKRGVAREKRVETGGKPREGREKGNHRSVVMSPCHHQQCHWSPPKFLLRLGCFPDNPGTVHWGRSGESVEGTGTTKECVTGEGQLGLRVHESNINSGEI